MFKVEKSCEEKGVCVGELSDRWMVGRVPSGGVVASVMLRATMKVSDAPESFTPLSASITFLRKTEPGKEFRCVVRVVKRGKSFYWRIYVF